MRKVRHDIARHNEVLIEDFTVQESMSVASFQRISVRYQQVYQPDPFGS